jgi:phospholipid/cholesterol/gamma-HCH transport system substrate-binding protein
MGKILRSPRLLGVVFIALLVLAVYLTYATFTKKFSSYDRVTLETSSIGLQLPNRADVKVRGVIVGEVLNSQADGEHGARITLGMYPDKIGEVPANVTGAIIPKTLFGEKYVSLEIPSSGPVGTLHTGAVIAKSQVSTEVEQVLNDLYPLLRAVQPADLNNTLTAISTALEGRGNELGQSLSTLDTYLKKINPQIPQLLQDLSQTAKVSNTYADIFPQIATILDNTVKTTGTLQAKETALSQTLRDIRSFSDTARVFLARNGDNLAEAGRLGTKVLKTAARYAPEIPCMSHALVHVQGRLAEAFRGFELHIVLETLPHQPNAYSPADRPHFGKAPGPSCHGLPNLPYSQAHPYPGLPFIDDGVRRGESGKGNVQRPAPQFGVDPLGYQGSPGDVATLRKLLQQRYGASAGDDLAVLQAGPLAAGGGS